MKTSTWDPDEVRQIRADRRHFAWLEHELRFHQDPVAQEIISDVMGMIQPDVFVRLHDRIDRALRVLGTIRRNCLEDSREGLVPSPRLMFAKIEQATRILRGEE